MRGYAKTLFILMMFAGALGAADTRAQSGDPLAAGEDAVAGNLSYFGDLLMRLDLSENLPLNLPDEQRFLGRARAGLRWQATDTLEIGAAIEVSQGSESNRLIRLAHDNERINDANVDLLYARWQLDNGFVQLGKHALPLELTSMLWDDDLRPVGLSLDHSIALNDFDRLQLTGGYYAGDHLYGDDSRVLAAQLAWRLREGAPTSGGILLSFLDFDNLEDITRSGLARSNRRALGVLLSDYRVGDAQFVLHTHWASVPLQARIDLAHNFGADDFENAARGTVIVGDMRRPGGWEAGLGFQRIQRDAVMAAFNSEEWWFHTAVRASLLSFGYGITENWRAQVQYFHERADGRDVYTNRALIDVRAEW
jgi:hypothetical protein